MIVNNRYSSPDIPDDSPVDLTSGQKSYAHIGNLTGPDCCDRSFDYDSQPNAVVGFETFQNHDKEKTAEAAQSIAERMRRWEPCSEEEMQQILETALGRAPTAVDRSRLVVELSIIRCDKMQKGNMNRLKEVLVRGIVGQPVSA